MAEEILTPDEGEKKFTQAELDALIGRRLAEERKKFPTAEELNKYNEWKSSQQTEAEKLAGIIAERDNAHRERDAVKEEMAQMRRERYLLSKGIDADDLDYYVFKIAKEVSENKTFEMAADEFLKDRPDTNRIRMDTGANVGGGGNGGRTPNSMFNDAIRKAARH